MKSLLLLLILGHFLPCITCVGLGMIIVTNPQLHDDLYRGRLGIVTNIEGEDMAEDHVVVTLWMGAIKGGPFITKSLRVNCLTSYEAFQKDRALLPVDWLRKDQTPVWSPSHSLSPIKVNVFAEPLSVYPEDYVHYTSMLYQNYEALLSYGEASVPPEEASLLSQKVAKLKHDICLMAAVIYENKGPQAVTQLASTILPYMYLFASCEKDLSDISGRGETRFITRWIMKLKIDLKGVSSPFEKARPFVLWLDDHPDYPMIQERYPILEQLLLDAKAVAIRLAIWWSPVCPMS